MKYLYLLSLLLFMTACSNDDPDCTEVDYQTAFTIEAEKTYCFPDEVELEIVAINNEFCPCNVVCVWEGQMTIDMIWTLASGERIEYKYMAAPQIQDMNEPLPEGIKVIADQDDIMFETACSGSNPSPAIVETIIQVTK